MKAESLTLQVQLMRDWYPYMSSDELLELFSMLTEGYCKACGTKGTNCCCERDE